jgi:hypothetical protein
MRFGLLHTALVPAAGNIENCHEECVDFAAMKRKIAILFHENDRQRTLNYLISHLAELWREDGHEVFLLFGVKEFVPADLVIVHVDLSVVPGEYLEFAKRYPIVLNGEVKDIRKSTFSQLLVKPGDAYDGKVIVKSNYNYAAVPERVLGAPVDPRGVSASFFGSPLDYQIFENPKAVPPLLFADPNVVVEKFTPEIENGLYISRAMVFLGDHVTCARMASRNPIVNSVTSIRTDYVQPHPDIVRLPGAMKFDYGKFDYVIHDGKPLLLDVNKTTAATHLPVVNPAQMARRRYRADGLQGYLERAR